MGKEPVKTPGSIDYDELVSTGDANSNRLKDIKHDPNDIAMIQFTSGTTGRPKAASLSQFGLTNNARCLAQHWGWSENSSVACNVPLFHIFGCLGGSMLSASVGSHCVFPAPGWVPNATFAAIEKYKLNVMYGTPTMYVDLIQKSDNDPELKKKLKSLEIGMAGGSLVPAEYRRLRSNRVKNSVSE